MKRTLAIIEEACRAHPPAYLAFSGGGDSTVLLDIVYRRTEHRPPLVYVDPQNDYPGTIDHVREGAARYRAELHTIKATKTLHQQWTRTGWPMLGKLPAREWMQRNRHLGIKVDCSSCCAAMKIAPARAWARANGYQLGLTGQRGAEDDRLRRTRAWADGTISRNKASGIWTANPLDGWTDTMIRRYTQQEHLAVHPAKARGWPAIGCVLCGGCARFAGSSYRLLRRDQPEMWRRFMVGHRGGEIVLAIKHGKSLQETRTAIDSLGGLEALAEQKPWVFDFLQYPPIDTSKKQ